MLSSAPLRRRFSEKYPYSLTNGSLVPHGTKDDENENDVRSECPSFSESDSSEGTWKSHDSMKGKLSIRNSTVQSNALLFLGSFCFFAMDARDVYRKLAEQNGDNDDDDSDDDDDDAIIVLGGTGLVVTKFVLLYVLAATFFLLNAIVDFVYAKKMQAKFLRRMASNNRVGSFVVSSSLQPPGEQMVGVSEDGPECVVFVGRTDDSGNQCSEPLLGDYDDDDEHDDGDDISMPQSLMEVEGEKRVAALFGIAAAADLLAALTCQLAHGDPPAASLALSLVANHVYVLQSVASRRAGRKNIRPRERNRWSCRDSFVPSPNRIGDTFFLVGSVMDVLSSYCNFIPALTDSMGLGLWDLLASSLWLANSVLVITSMLRKR